MKKVTLPSGNELEITPAPFKQARAVYQACAIQLLRVNVDPNEELYNLIKNILCLGVSAKEIEEALEPCLRRCIYKGLKIKEDTFEPEEAREDYLDICCEVARENIRPFTKSLFAQFKALSTMADLIVRPSNASQIQRGSSQTSDSSMQDTGT